MSNMFYNDIWIRKEDIMWKWIRTGKWIQGSDTQHKFRLLGKGRVLPERVVSPLQGPISTKEKLFNWKAP